MKNRRYDYADSGGAEFGNLWGKPPSAAPDSAQPPKGFSI